MKPIYTQEEFNKAKSENKLLLECYHCNKPFLKEKRYIKAVLNNTNYSQKCKFCSKLCLYKSKTSKKIVTCKQCNKDFKKIPSQIKKFPNHFCSRSCSGTYNNTHKKYGTRRSKLEIWLEDQLTILYPNLLIDFNKKEAISSELDIYIPSLKLAFELNGIFHYEPIYGQDKLDKIQNNDQRKLQACAEREISFCIIDASSFKKFKPLKAQKYLDIITNIINKHL